jgi:nitrous oxidase accessory protein
VTSADALAQALRDAAPGTALCLEPGRYEGPFLVPEAVTVWGGREAVLFAARGRGTVVKLAGKQARLQGVTIDGAGGRYAAMDGAVLIAADGVEVRGIRVRRAVFGIMAEQAKRARIVGNEVQGEGGEFIGMRGDGIRLWETHDSLVEGNVVEDSRDVVVWHSSRNEVRGNTVRRCRYGTHFMYSHDNVAEDNRFEANEVGIFGMFSRQLTVRGNLFAESQGAAGIGLGLKESGNVTAVSNTFLHNTTGIYLDSSPLQLDETNLFEGNVLRLSDVAVAFHSSGARNRFTGNSFDDNATQVRVEGGGDAMEVAWEGNHFDDYRGYDLDRDGVGDVPYELRDLGDDLVGRQPNLALLRGTPALQLVSAAGELIPLFAPKTILRDPAPRVQGRPVELTNAN